MTYIIQGERITCEPTKAQPPRYDVRTYPERMDDELDALRAEVATLRAVVTKLDELNALRAEVATLRAVVTMLVDALAELGVRVQP